MSWGDTLQTLSGVVIGGGVTLASDYLLDGRRERRDSANHRRDRQEGFSDKRIEFELDTLTKLHAALTRYLRGVARFHLDDMAIAKQSGEPYGSYQTGNDELDEELRKSNVEVGYLNGLVLDDDLRHRVDELRDLAFALSYEPKTIDDAKRLYNGVSTQGSLILQEVSRQIRNLYARGV